MNSRPIVPAVLDDVPDGTRATIASMRAADAARALLAANGLPPRWRHREQFTVLATSFGTGHDFLVAWQAWRADPQRCDRLVYVAVEPHPLTRDDMQRVHGRSPLRACADALVERWPPLTHNLHDLVFEGGRVRLMLACGEVRAWLPELRIEVDAFWLGHNAADSAPPHFDARMCKALGRLAAPEATLAMRDNADRLRGALTSAGFALHSAVDEAGSDGVVSGTFAPRFTPRRAPAYRARAAGGQRRALIVGAGLAGCAAAWALAEQGWQTTLIDRRAAPASEASGNAGGLFHGVVNAHDGVHARFNRAAALAARTAVEHALARAGGEPGAQGGVAGLLRLEHDLSPLDMHDRLAGLGLPGDYVQALSASEASALCGLVLRQPAWFYPGGGWVQPAGLARSFLQRAGDHATLRMGLAVQAIRRTSRGWALIDPQGQLIEEAETVVLANANDALRLLMQPAWPVRETRGQISGAPFGAGMPCTRLPIAGAGYLLPPIDATVWFGATSQAGDLDASVRPDDHDSNVAQLARLVDRPVALRADQLQGRTGWRCSAIDRLPIVGAVPDLASFGASTPDQPRLMPRVPGLHVFSGLGSRGITWSALGARVLAGWVCGSAFPLESGLIDAIDPARFAVRARRRSGGG